MITSLDRRIETWALTVSKMHIRQQTHLEMEALEAGAGSSFLCHVPFKSSLLQAVKEWASESNIPLPVA